MSLQKVIEEWKQLPLKELLIQLYIENDMTIEQVAEELKVSKGVIFNWLKKYNISKNKNLWS